MTRLPPLAARPRRVFVGACLASFVLCVGAVVTWSALPDEVRAGFNLGQILTLVGILAILVLLVWVLGMSTVRADRDVIRLRNGLRVRQYAWSQVAGIRMREGDPWARLILRIPVAGGAEAGEPQTVGMLGLQPSDGPRTLAALVRLRELHAAA